MPKRNMKKRILVAPLNWGLGHATRCIPIINALLHLGFAPIIASDGSALALLKKEFPELPFETLPEYAITYPKNSAFFKWKLLCDAPFILKSIKKEQRTTDALVLKYGLSGIISDNRLGVYSSSVPSVYITHQLEVISGNTTFFSSKIHQHFINRFAECWIPDFETEPHLSGAMGHPSAIDLPLKYIGPLSRLQKQALPKRYAVMIVLSGPEPQRQYLESELVAAFKTCEKPILIVKGVIAPQQTVTQKGLFTSYNFMQTDALENAINSSDIIVSRSGYTTIMDLAKLNKKAFFIPTPGQFEQEYLAERLEALKIAPFCKQGAFKAALLDTLKNYSGFQNEIPPTDFESLFRLF